MSSSNEASVRYREYRDRSDLDQLVALIERDLSEPYSIFTYRYFIHTWPELCILAVDNDSDGGDKVVAGIISKLEHHPSNFFPALRGYIGMVAVEANYRRYGIARKLVDLTFKKMQAVGVTERNDILR